MRIRPHFLRSPRAFVALAMFAAVLFPVAAASTAQAQPGNFCDGRPVTVDLNLGQVPTDGDDVILGTGGPDVIAAMGGNDTICSLGGDDIIWGQAGNDGIFGGPGDDKLRGGPGDDLVYGDDGADDLAGGTGNDIVFGGLGNDPVLRGGSGDDLVDGGSGDDPLVAGNGGLDTVVGGTGNDKVTGGPRPDVLFGDFGDDELKGNKGADFIDGGPGADSLFGGPQPDDLDGGEGVDKCSGGTTGEDAPEDNNAQNCETEIAIEGANFESPISGLQPIGQANIGGPIVGGMLATITNIDILESNPEQLAISFQAGPDGCFAATATAIDVETAIMIELVVGSPEDGPEVCAAVIVEHQIVIQLTEPIDGRDVIPLPAIDIEIPEGPIGIPGGPIEIPGGPIEIPGGPIIGPMIDIGSLGPPLLDADLAPGTITSFEVVLGTPDQIKVFFTAGPIECIAAEAAAFGYDDRIELLMVISPRADVPLDTVCPAIAVNHEITIDLSAPINDRPVVIGEFPPGLLPGGSAWARAAG